MHLYIDFKIENHLSDLADIFSEEDILDRWERQGSISLKDLMILSYSEEGQWGRCPSTLALLTSCSEAIEWWVWMGQPSESTLNQLGILAELLSHEFVCRLKCSSIDLTDQGDLILDDFVIISGRKVVDSVQTEVGMDLRLDTLRLVEDNDECSEATQTNVTESPL